LKSIITNDQQFNRQCKIDVSFVAVFRIGKKTTLTSNLE